MKNAYGSLAVGLGCILAAVLIVLVAADVRAWPAALTAGDVQVRATPLRADPWREPSRIPFGVSRRLLGLGDDLEFRRAVRLFINTRPYVGNSPFLGNIRPVDAAKRRFRAIERGDGDPVRRSAAANFRAILTSEGGRFADTGYVRQALRLFRDAIRIDPRNEQPKFNLELLLDRTEGGGGPGSRGTGSPRVFQEVEGAASTAPGRGY